MALTPRLEIKQSQSLLLTPQLRQAIGLLTLNNLELNEIVEQELASNPLLEREENYLADTPDNAQQTIDDLEKTPENPYQETEIALDMDTQNNFDDFGSDTEGYNNFETTDWADYNKSKLARATDDNFDYFEERLTKEKSLYEILDEQIDLKFKEPIDKLLAKILSEQLDAAGYFRGDLITIAQKLKTSPQRLQKILDQLKEFEPSGIFAENLSECLKIQLVDTDKLTPVLKTILDNLPLLAERKIKELTKLCQCSEAEILKAAAELKTLNPKPTATFFLAENISIIPDVIVKRSKTGEYRVELNNMSLPRLLINHNYYSNLKQNKSAQRYLKENFSRASFLIKAMHQRATTILRVAEEIVLRQYQFFENGIEYLHSMTLKDLAEVLEVNESTISRVTTGKYMTTPRGMFELKYFFSNAAGSYIGNTETSTTTIKHKIKKLIDNENPSHILSDDNIVALLGQEGIKIARRTVTKYREALGIPTSGQRKRTKRG